MPPSYCYEYYIKHNYGYWTACCPGLTLYATGETSGEAFSKLQDEVNEYVTEIAKNIRKIPIKLVLTEDQNRINKWLEKLETPPF